LTTELLIPARSKPSFWGRRQETRGIDEIRLLDFKNKKSQGRDRGEGKVRVDDSTRTPARTGMIAAFCISTPLPAPLGHGGKVEKGAEPVNKMKIHSFGRAGAFSKTVSIGDKKAIKLK